MADQGEGKRRREKETADKDTPRRTPEAPSPLLDLSDAAVRKMIKHAKKRGYVTYDAAQRRAALRGGHLRADRGHHGDAQRDGHQRRRVRRSRARKTRSEEADDDESRRRSGRGHAEGRRRPTEKKEPSERTDDPVRMYLREMGSVELLSREGEIAIAKRIEAGREAMIAGLCESPLTFQAIIIWRDELNDGKVFLRDIIDLEATYAGPDAKNGMAPANAPARPAPGGQRRAGNGGTPLSRSRAGRRRPRRRAAPAVSSRRPATPRGRRSAGRAKATWTTTRSRTRCRSRRSRPS